MQVVPIKRAAGLLFVGGKVLLPGGGIDFGARLSELLQCFLSVMLLVHHFGLYYLVCAN